MPLCKFDLNRTDECHVSKEYAAALIAHYDTGPWGQVVAQNAKCEVVAQHSCLDLEKCEIDGTGLCVAQRSWIVQKLVLAESDGGMGMNSDRCGIFGRLLVDGASCLPQLNQISCLAATGGSSGIPCAWDELRGICNAAREGILFVLRRDYRDELARVSLRRDLCTSREGTFASCTGDCRLVNGTCTLRPLDALLAVTGEDCPLSVLLRQNAGCWRQADEVSCLSRTRADGMKECDWRLGLCEAHPMALEFDLLLTLGLGQPDILTPMRASQTQCAEFSNAVSCVAACAPPIGKSSKAAVQWRPHRMMALLFSAAVASRDIF